MASSPLGEFLRARRALVSPQSVGMPSAGTRRVPGLRREELAVIAGVSSNYYTKLEQGRETNPSTSVLEALARALELDDDGRAHLFALAGLVPPPRGSRGPRAVAPALLRMMDLWPGMPAVVLSDTLDVLARNELAAALHAGFTITDNVPRMIFLDPEGRRFYVDWQRAAESAVANLREAAGALQGDPRLQELVEELSQGSAEFRRLWAQGTVRGKTREAKRFRHPQVGDLDLEYQSFDVRGVAGQRLIVYQAEQGSASAEALTLLGALAATDRPS